MKKRKQFSFVVVVSIQNIRQTYGSAKMSFIFCDALPFFSCYLYPVLAIIHLPHIHLTIQMILMQLKAKYIHVVCERAYIPTAMGRFLEHRMPWTLMWKFHLAASVLANCIEMAHVGIAQAAIMGAYEPNRTIWKHSVFNGAKLCSQKNIRWILCIRLVFRIFCAGN